MLHGQNSSWIRNIRLIRSRNWLLSNLSSSIKASKLWRALESLKYLIISPCTKKLSTKKSPDGLEERPKRLNKVKQGHFVEFTNCTWLMIQSIRIHKSASKLMSKIYSRLTGLTFGRNHRNSSILSRLGIVITSGFIKLVDKVIRTYTR